MHVPIWKMTILKIFEKRPFEDTVPHIIDLSNFSAFSSVKQQFVVLVNVISIWMNCLGRNQALEIGHFYLDPRNSPFFSLPINVYCDFQKYIDA